MRLCVIRRQLDIAQSQRKDNQKNLVAKIIKPKLGLLELSRQLGSVTQVCKVFGYSRDSFYDFKKLYEE